jgi:hypothetical protein
MRPSLTLFLLTLALPSCIIAPGATPSVDANFGGVSQYNFRGVPYDEKGALQSDVTLSFPTTRENGVLSFNAFGNMALSNNNDGGFSGNGNSREVTRADYTVAYSERMPDYDFSFGITHYTFPSMASRFGGYGAYAGAGSYGEGTTQLFGSATLDLWDLAPTIEVFVDVDVAPGAYVNNHIKREFDLKEKTWFEARANLAIAEGGYAEMYYGKEKTSLADFGVAGVVKHEYDENTVLSAGLHASTLIEGDYRDNIDAAGADATNVWISIGAGFSW